MTCTSQMLISLIVFVVAVPLAHSQVQEEINQQKILVAEDLMLGLITMRNDLPDRWAALQRRHLVNTFNLDNFEVSEKFIEEITTIDSKLGLEYKRVTHNDARQIATDRDDGWEVNVGSYQAKSLKLQMVSPNPWVPVTAFQNTSYPSTDPFNWSIPSLNGARAGIMSKPDRLVQVFQGTHHCMLSKPEKNNALRTIWGKEMPKLPLYFVIVFDEKSRLTKQVSIVEYPTGVTSASIEKSQYQIREHAEIEWKLFSYKKTDGAKKSISLPCGIKIQSTLNPNEEIECVNEIDWLLGRDVPDSALIDPRDKKFSEPIFVRKSR